jgi:hypothetical protein
MRTFDPTVRPTGVRERHVYVHVRVLATRRRHLSSEGHKGRALACEWLLGVGVCAQRIFSKSRKARRLIRTISSAVQRDNASAPPEKRAASRA